MRDNRKQALASRRGLFFAYWSPSRDASPSSADRAMPTSWPRLERWQESFACAGGVNVQAEFHIYGVPGSAAHSNRL